MHPDLAGFASQSQAGQLIANAVSVYFNPLDFGAKGDGDTDDSAAIQEAIDRLSAMGGGILLFPPGNFRCNIVLKQGVYLVGTSTVTLPWRSNMTRFTQAGPGAVIDTPAYAIYGGGVHGIGINGLGALVSGQGIRFRNVTHGFISQVTLQQLADEAIRFDAGGANTIEDVLAQGALLNRTRVAKIGVVDIAGTDHFLSRIEATASLTALSSVDAYLCAFVIRDVANSLNACVGEISDEGFYFTSTALINKLTNVRADLNFGHGFHFAGRMNMLTACHAFRNSQETTNTYSGFYFDSTAGDNVLAGCRAEGLDVDAKKPKYGFEDLVNTGIRNSYAACRGVENLTNLYYVDGGASAGPDTSSTVVT